MRSATDPLPENTSARRILNQLRTGLARQRNGEILISDGERVGRVYAFQGKVAWAHSSTQPVHLSQLLQSRAGLSNEDISNVVQESRQHKKPLGETLVALGLIDEALLKKCLQEHVATHLREILAMSAGASALFIPNDRSYRMGIAFPLEELTYAIGLRDDAIAQEAELSVVSNERVDSDEMLVAQSVGNYAMANLPSVAAVAVLNADRGEVLDIQGDNMTSMELLGSLTGMAAQAFLHPSVTAAADIRDRAQGRPGTPHYFNELVFTSATHYHYFGRVDVLPSLLIAALCPCFIEMNLLVQKGREICLLQAL